MFPPARLACVGLLLSTCGCASATMSFPFKPASAPAADHGRNILLLPAYDDRPQVLAGERSPQYVGNKGALDISTEGPPLAEVLMEPLEMFLRAAGHRTRRWRGDPEVTVDQAIQSHRADLGLRIILRGFELSLWRRKLRGGIELEAVAYDPAGRVIARTLHRHGRSLPTVGFDAWVAPDESAVASYLYRQIEALLTGDADVKVALGFAPVPAPTRAPKVEQPESTAQEVEHFVQRVLIVPTQIADDTLQALAATLDEQLARVVSAAPGKHLVHLDAVTSRLGQRDPRNLACRRADCVGSLGTMFGAHVVLVPRLTGGDVKKLDLIAVDARRGEVLAKRSDALPGETIDELQVAVEAALGVLVPPP